MPEPVVVDVLLAVRTGVGHGLRGQSRGARDVREVVDTAADPVDGNFGDDIVPRRVDQLHVLRDGLPDLQAVLHAAESHLERELTLRGRAAACDGSARAECCCECKGEEKKLHAAHAAILRELMVEVRCS